MNENKLKTTDETGALAMALKTPFITAVKVTLGIAVGHLLILMAMMTFVIIPYMAYKLLH